MESINTIIEGHVQPLLLTEKLQKLQRPSPIPAMRGELVEDPVAQEILRVGSDALHKVEVFIKENGISTLAPLENAYGFAAVVLDAGDKVVRLSKNTPAEKPQAPYVLQPLSGEYIDQRIYVQISKKLNTKGITENDVKMVQADLNKQGWYWSDAGTDNLGKDEAGNLLIIDGSVTHTD